MPHGSFHYTSALCFITPFIKSRCLGVSGVPNFEHKKFNVTLTEVKRKSLPDLDDALAREVGDFDSLDALRTAVRTDITESAKRETDAEVRTRLLDEIIGANSFDIPPNVPVYAFQHGSDVVPMLDGQVIGGTPSNVHQVVLPGPLSPIDAHNNAEYQASIEAWEAAYLAEHGTPPPYVDLFTGEVVDHSVFTASE